MSAHGHAVDAAGCRLWVDRGGAGPPIVFLHGFTGDAESMAPAARPLAARFETIRLELLGHGRSDAREDVAAYRMERCIQQVAAALDALGLESVHLYGYSMGGRVALSFCHAYPNRVRSALLVGATAGLAAPEDRASRVASDEALAGRIEAEGLEAFVDFWMALPLFASQKRLGERALEGARAQRLRCRPTGLANSLRGMGTGAMPPLHNVLSSIAVPICLVAGDEDGKFKAIAAELAAALGHGKCAVIAEAGHAAHLENPSEVARVAADFFASHDAREPATERLERTR